MSTLFFIGIKCKRALVMSARKLLKGSDTTKRTKRILSICDKRHFANHGTSLFIVLMNGHLSMHKIFPDRIAAVFIMVEFSIGVLKADADRRQEIALQQMKGCDRVCAFHAEVDGNVRSAHPLPNDM